MTRRKQKIVDTTQPDPEHNIVPTASEQPSSETPTIPAEETNHAAGLSKRAVPITRSYKTTLALPDKGVAIGVRDGHDWVVSFPGDPGTKIKDKLMNVGFAYHNRKWKVFTNAANRSPVEALIRDLKRQLGEEIKVNEYDAKQVVLAFDVSPADGIINQLQDRDFYFRSDRTWNAADTPANRKFARDLIQSLPAASRSAAASQRMAR